MRVGAPVETERPKQFVEDVVGQRATDGVPTKGWWLLMTASRVRVTTTLLTASTLKLEMLRQCSVAATARRMSGLALASAAGRLVAQQDLTLRLAPASTINGQRPCRVTPGQRGPGDKQPGT